MRDGGQVAAEDQPDLEPPIGRRDLPDAVQAARRGADELTARLDAAIQPRIDAHLSIYEEAVERLISTHRALVDQTDLEIGAATRWAAIWELSGRCLAISKVLIHDLRGGFASEAIGTVRALHEANQLLGALTFHEEEEAVRRWLAGDYVTPQQARTILGSKQALALERMREAGIEPVGGDVVELGREIYGFMSESAHHRRGGFRDSISPDLRRFVFGPHPDARIRATYVEYAGHLLEEVVMVVGDAFADFLGRDYYTNTVTPLIQSLERVREQMPLD